MSIEQHAGNYHAWAVRERVCVYCLRVICHPDMPFKGKQESILLFLQWAPFVPWCTKRAACYILALAHFVIFLPLGNKSVVLFCRYFICEGFQLMILVSTLKQMWRIDNFSLETASRQKITITKKFKAVLNKMGYFMWDKHTYISVLYSLSHAE